MFIDFGIPYDKRQRVLDIIWTVGGVDARAGRKKRTLFIPIC
jgi:hypothetical protein